MRPLRIITIAVAALAFPLGLGAAVYAAAGGSLDSSADDALVSVSTETLGRPVTTTDEPEDVSGPCDEAEHRNDPRCAPGATTEEDRRNDDRRADDDPGDDRRGRGNDDADRSGPSENSGPGSSNSGPGGGDD